MNSKKSVIFKRASGILFPVSAWPNDRDNVGTLGKSALSLADWLAAAGQKYLQILPLGPTGFSNSPFDGPALEAWNHYFIDLDILRREGDISSGRLEKYVEGLPPAKVVDYGFLWGRKLPLLKNAAREFINKKSFRRTDFSKFIKKNKSWLEPAAVFLALKDYQGGRSWNEWGRYQKPLKDFSQYPDEVRQLTEVYFYLQWQFHKQWQKLIEYFHKKGLSIIGDMPAYAAFDSADVWAHQELFHLDEKGRALFVAGVPPDYFSKTGQLWGNPLPRWHRLDKQKIIKSKYSDRPLNFPAAAEAPAVLNMVKKRFLRLLELVDFIKIDHFRGLAGYGVIPAEDKTARRCRWVSGKGADLLADLKKSGGRLNLIAEDLGVITPEVENLRKKFQIPGMVIFQFAGWADEDLKKGKYFPDNYRLENVAYPGTHDNDTFFGWLGKIPVPQKNTVKKYLMENSADEKNLNWLMAAKLINSKAGLVIFPIQDILELGGSARFNTPGTFSAHNWSWRLGAGRLPIKTAEKLRRLSRNAGR